MRLHITHFKWWKSWASGLGKNGKWYPLCAFNVLNIAIVNHSHDVARCDLQMKTPRNGGRMLLKMCSVMEFRKSNLYKICKKTIVKFLTFKTQRSLFNWLIKITNRMTINSCYSNRSCKQKNASKLVIIKSYYKLWSLTRPFMMLLMNVLVNVLAV